MQHLSNLRLLLIRLGIAMLGFMLCRIIFFAFNAGMFPDWKMMDFVYGIYFDAATVAMFFSPFIFLSLIPLHFRKQKYLLLLRDFSFHLINLVSIILNCIDVKFIQFTAKRSTADLFTILSFGSDAENILPSVFRDYWWVAILVAMVFGLCFWLYRRTKKKETESHFSYLPQSVVFVLSIGIFVLIARGGFGLKPISVITASQYTSPANLPIVLNTPFTMVKTWGQPGLTEFHFYSDEEVAKVYNPIRKVSGKFSHPNCNVVVFLMESYSTHYLQSYCGRERSCAPFLDSLIGESLMFTHAYANGKRSIEGTPAVMASLPTFMPEPFITSRYNANRITSFGTLLKKYGYHSSYFHGATNGSMGFDNFCKLAQFDDYNGRSEFNDDRYFNGNWGIHDEEFFQFFADKLISYPRPQVGILFSITSHHPYNFPDKYAKVFNKSQIPMENAVEYADFALRRFFDRMKKTDWYNNTLFIITADHTGDSQDPYYAGVEGRYRIPLVFFHPGDSTLKGKNDKVVSQADILPSVMDYLGYDMQFFSYGQSVFENNEGLAYMMVNDIHQLVTKDYLIQFAGEDPIALFKLPEDSLCEKNILSSDPQAPYMTKLIKSVVQVYNNTHIKNKMTVE